MAKQDVQELEKEVAKLRARNDQLEADNQALQSAGKSSVPAGCARVTVPLKRTTGFVVRRLDMHLPPALAQRLRDLRDGLQAAGATVGSGRRQGREVESIQEAALWLLENLEGPGIQDMAASDAVRKKQEDAKQLKLQQTRKQHAEKLKKLAEEENPES